MRNEMVDDCGCKLTRTEKGLHMEDCPLHKAAPTMEIAIRSMLVNINLALKMGVNNAYLRLAVEAGEAALKAAEGRKEK